MINVDNFKITERQKEIVVALLHEHVHSLSDSLVFAFKNCDDPAFYRAVNDIQGCNDLIQELNNCVVDYDDIELPFQ